MVQSFITIGDESVAWGTKATTLTRGIEAQVDTTSPAVEQRESRGLRPSVVGVPSDRSRTFRYGGEVSLMADLLSKSHGLLLAAIGTTVATTTPVGATDARLHTITPGAAGVTRSTTIHKARADETAATLYHTDYLGAMAKSLKLSVSPKGWPTVEVAYGYKTEDTSAASVTPAYPTDAAPFGDREVTITLDSVTECARQFEVTIPTGLDFERFRLCPDGQKKPNPKERPVPTGSFSLDFTDHTLYDAYLAGTILENLVFEANLGADSIETGFDFFARLTLPFIQLTGSAPQVSLDADPVQALPFKVLADPTGTLPLWQLEYQTTDTAP